MLVMQCSIMLSPLLHHPQCTLRQCHQLTQCPPWSVSPWSLHLYVHSKRQLPIYQLQSDQWRLCKEGSGIAYGFSAQMRTDMPHLHMYIPVYSILHCHVLYVCTSTSTLHCVGVHNYIYVYVLYPHKHFSALCRHTYIYIYIYYIYIYIYIAMYVHMYVLVQYPTSFPPSLLSSSPSTSLPPITQPLLHLSLPLSHDLPTDQVYLYDGTQSCQAANFVPFLVLAVLVIFCFVLVAPFLLCLLTKKRWTVSFLHAHCSISN